jgi:hypothetical protein
MRLNRYFGRGPCRRAGAAGALGALVGTGAWLAPEVARADRYYVIEERVYEPTSSFNLGFDLEGAVPVDLPRSPTGNDVRGGGGFKIRFGDQIRWPRFRLVPEGGYAYDHLFASDDFGNAYAWDVHRLFGGARFEFGRFVVPGFYVHAGYGWRDTADPAVARSNGLAFDAGALLDFHLIPHFGFGAHAEYALVDAQPFTPHWIAIGGHVDVAF